MRANYIYSKASGGCGKILWAFLKHKNEIKIVDREMATFK